MSLLTRRGLLLAKVESTYNVDASPDPLTDAVLVESPDFTADISVLERNFATFDLSPKAHSIGRKLAGMTFTTELRGNGKQNSGALADAPIIGRLLRACGYSETALTAAESSDVTEVGEHARSVTWTTGGTLTNTEEVSYFLTVTTAGGTGTAEVKITSDHPSETEQTGVVLTDATSITVGSLGLEITPDLGGNNVEVGQEWCVSLSPTGLRYDPVSDSQESVTLYLYLDGVLHKMPGGRGTFSLNGEAGQYGKIEWQFTGQFVKPVDATMPTNAKYETALPPQVELARLRVGGYPAVVNAFSFDQANSINVRPDANGSDGYDGVNITERAPTGGIDPEATLVASQDWWGQLADAKVMPFQMRFGTQAGNTVWVKSEGVQYTGLTYQDRNGTRTYDAGLKFSRRQGNDEVRFVFC
jgi:hypothetical protein